MTPELAKLQIPITRLGERRNLYRPSKGPHVREEIFKGELTKSMLNVSNRTPRLYQHHPFTNEASPLEQPHRRCIY